MYLQYFFCNFDSILICIIIGTVQYIRSQKKNAQLVYDGFIYNKKLTQASGHTTWRCSDVSKNKCRAVCVTKFSRLISARRNHDHEPHWNRISNRILYNVESDLEEILCIKTTVSDKFKIEDLIIYS